MSRNMRAIEDSFVLIHRIRERLQNAQVCATEMPIDCPDVVARIADALEALDEFDTDLDSDAGYLCEGIEWEVR